MLACLILMPSRTLFAEQIGQQSRLNIPHMKLVAAIAHDFPNVEVISLNHQHEAGHFVLFGMQNLRPWKVELADPQGKTFVRRYGFQVENALGPRSVDVVAKEVSGRLTHEYWWDVFQTERGIEIRRVAGYSRH